MTDRDHKDAAAAMQLRRDWEPKGWDTGWAGDRWWALRLDGTGEPIGPAATPEKLDALLAAEEAADRAAQGFAEGAGIPDAVERFGQMSAGGEISDEEAAWRLVQFGGAALTLAGARDLLANWRTARAEYSGRDRGAEKWLRPGP